ncbi:MAG: NAD(P)H:quinone oxidoreductase [Desulfobacterales bacterium]
MKILIVYYSKYGHVLQMAEAAAEGVESVEGCEAVMRRAEEFPDELKRIESDEFAKPVWERQKDTPACTLDDFREADGILFGTPTRYGNMIAQLKRLIDSTAQLWMEGAFEGKPAGLFTSTATTHGGQETTLLASMIPMLHLGMIIAGVPYSTPGMLHTEGRGGTPYGATTVAGQKNELKPAKEDLEIARALGRRIADIAKKLGG